MNEFIIDGVVAGIGEKRNDRAPKKMKMKFLFKMRNKNIWEE